ncbi:hypothetical protein E2C01_082996 [Portunus trituberculatus]|uniref:Uncharacterized protein n=1 Tax=Portunus trituberculatus TaxID=210409 RepID=A0A5B7J6L4_PORTR|nr:hypothetical protein [Portunus trituberculatus]
MVVQWFRKNGTLLNQTGMLNPVPGCLCITCKMETSINYTTEHAVSTHTSPCA